jgi:flagellar hook-basal body complex protein FliE
MSVNPISARPLGLPEINRTAGAGRSAAPGEAAGLGGTFAQALDGLSAAQAGSDELMRKLAAGESVDLHQVMLAAEETDVAFRVALAMRDKLVEAYHEVMRMAI